MVGTSLAVSPSSACRCRSQVKLDIPAVRDRQRHRLLDCCRRVAAELLSHALTSIYGYLRDRFGEVSYKSGSALFIVSRLLGATARIYIVLYVIHQYLLESIGVPFWVTSGVVF